MAEPLTDDELAERIAAHFGCGKDGALETLANLRAFAARQALEAAAPELLAAAKAVIKFFDEAYGEDMRREWPPLADLAAAVAKAEGRA